MQFSSGNLVFIDNTHKETSSLINRNQFVKLVLEKTSSYAKKPWLLKSSKQWYDYIFPPILERSKNIFDHPGISFNNFGEITTSRIDKWWVINYLVQERGYPKLVVEVAQNLLKISGVEEVGFRINAEKQQIKFVVLVNMPKYDDNLMDQLLEVEIKWTKLGITHNYTLDFDYRPLPYANLATLNSEGYIIYQD